MNVTKTTAKMDRQYAIEQKYHYSTKSNDIPYKSHGLIKDSYGTVDGKAKYVRTAVRNRKPQP